MAAALKWLAYHQMRDGGWSFNHCLAPSCKGQCRNPGELAKARNGATAIAILPFLGAGQTHTEGKYKPTVKNGLYYLVSHMKVDAKGGSLHEGDRGAMYAHGLGAIALSEAYGMTHDDIPLLVEKSAVASSMKANPIELTMDELARILSAAM